MYVFNTKKIVLSNDVIFDKDKSWDWKSGQEEFVSVVFPVEDSEGRGEGTVEQIDEIQDDSDKSNHSVQLDTGNDDEGRGHSCSTLVKLRSLEDIYERCHMSIIEPENYQEAVSDIAWQEAMNVELEMIDKNETWELVERLVEQPVIGVKWVYKTKLNLDGTIQKHKTRLVAKGYA